MRVGLQSLRKSKASVTAPEYTATFNVDGKVRRFHAVVRVRQGNAIRFREVAIDRLLAFNMDQGRRVYEAIAKLHRDGHAPGLPLDLGELENFPTSRDSNAVPVHAG